jgi:hypothetical protein
VIGRSTSGVRLIAFDKKDKLIEISKIIAVSDE